MGRVLVSIILQMHSKLSNAQCFRNYENISFTAEIEKILISDLSSGKDRMSWLHSALDPTTTNDTIVTSPPPQWPSFRRDIKTLALIRVKFWLTLKGRGPGMTY